ncbi:hypothetical protein J7I98_30935 [Streptomyces sp. ISL-98]|uniref:WD40 repeat domain-containing protein n=1 Tax=Streptomyces sp. ISL-98 TaxID=2819192 RepID=UPI001BECFFEF|nr:hypothetical protein [Streptomyces sp. ISL-98]MBT2510193.1 hypothetical protein [Streptomyces sp. ISL-98]
MSDALREWAAAHARSVGKDGRTVPAAAVPGTRTAPGSGSLGGVKDRTPDTLRPYSRLCLAVMDGLPVGAASAVAPVSNVGGPPPRVFALTQGGSTGLRVEPLDRFSLEPLEWPIGWVDSGHGYPVLATSGGGNNLYLHDIGAGFRKDSYEANFSLESAKLTTGRDGALLLTAGGPDNVVIWDLAEREPGSSTHVLFGLQATSSVELSEVQPDGANLVATGHRDGRVLVWGFNDPTLVLIHEMDAAAGPVWAVAWGMLPNGSALLASGHDDGRICVWNGLTGTLLVTCPPCPGRVDSVAWTVGPSGLNVLASGHSDGTVRIWSWQTGSVLHEFDGLTAHGVPPFDVGSMVGWLLLPQGSIWLYAAGETGSRIWELELDGLLAASGTLSSTEDTDPAAITRPRPLPATVCRGLVRLAASGVCPPLGLLDDLVALSGPATAPLLDERIRSLADHPGVRILRDLEWPAPARVGLAGLLAAGLSEPDTVPPPGHGPRELSDALRRALIGAPSRVPDREPPLAALRAAADAITGRTAALLAVIGPEAVADDPVLPLRMAQQAPAMPSVDLRRLQLLTGAASTAARHAGTTVHAPGSGGISRTGRITQMLPSQLALPDRLLTLRYARHELLYRLHSSAAQWAPEPVTLVLDTSPPTFGPPEVVLRSLAHLLATTLWCHGRHATFVGLDRPDLLRPVSRPADLAMLWTSRTLEPPDLDAALNTAASTGMPTVLLALHHLARDHTLVAGPRLRLATTHLYDDLPRARPPESHHVHLPPDATGRRLTDAVRLLLTGDGPS